MPDPRVERVAALVGRVEGAACWMAGEATRAGLAGGLGGVVLWWFAAGERVGVWWQAAVVSVLVLLVGWMVFARLERTVLKEI